VDAVLPLLVGWMHDDRLQDAVLADVVGEFVDLRFRKLGARVGGVFAEPIQRYEQRMPCAVCGGELHGARRLRGVCLLHRSPRLASANVDLNVRVGVEKLELTSLRFGPRQSHEPIVPLAQAAR
jgi:hypothetical protein